jgi:predicted PurR-regulated permease PerM
MEDFKETSPFENNVLGETAKEHLRATRPWLMFFAILFFILTGFMLFGALGMLFTGSSNAVPALFMMLIVVGIYFFFAWSIYQYAKNIKNALDSYDMSYLDEAFRHQKNYWMGLGIIMIIVIAFYILVFAILGVGGAAALSRFGR